MHIDYDGKVQTALRSVVKSVLGDVITDGLQGKHHFYITFRTNVEGVQIPDNLKQEYPSEMTIVIQHKFWGLKITDERIEVGLYFNGSPEMLHIPFEAISAFMDPSVQFALQFHDSTEDMADDELLDAETLEEAEAIIAAEEAKVQASAADDNQAPDDQTDQTAVGHKDDNADSDNVVTLDAFRKK